MLAHLPPALLAILAGVVVLGVLIFVHEFGHFIAAKSVGIAVLRFSFGLGAPTPLRVQRGETEYCLSWIPLGGYVKMAGLDEEGAAGKLEGPAEARSWPKERTFDGKPLWARVYVISAGVVMNALFAVLVYAVLAGAYGVREDRTITVGSVDTLDLPLGAAALARLQPGDRIVRINGAPMEGWGDIQEALLTADEPMIRIEVEGGTAPIVLEVPRSEQRARAALVGALTPWREPVSGEVLPGQPAAVGGVQPGDRILWVDGTPVRTWEHFVHVIEASAGRQLTLVVRRGAEEVPLRVTPRATNVRDAVSGRSREVGRIGVGSQLPPLRRYGVLGSVGQGFVQAGNAGTLVLSTLKGLVLGQLSARDIGGPILVGQLSGQVARLGLEPFLSFMALFSMNLAILNLLPIPVLDGGHLVFLAIEAVRRKPVSDEQRHRWTQVGFLVLVGIMLLALGNDLLRILP
ncbi:MAG: RIP metalloprotease RseP [Gemmatimonadota bacterium]